MSKTHAQTHLHTLSLTNNKSMTSIECFCHVCCWLLFFRVFLLFSIHFFSFSLLALSKCAYRDIDIVYVLKMCKIQNHKQLWIYWHQTFMQTPIDCVYTLRCSICVLFFLLASLSRSRFRRFFSLQPICNAYVFYFARLVFNNMMSSTSKS